MNNKLPEPQDQDQADITRQSDEADSSKKQSAVVVKTTPKTKVKKPDIFSGIEPEKGLKAIMTKVIRLWRGES